jgi:alpha-ketoglutarate-dependent taurine dioxygenase
VAESLTTEIAWQRGDVAIIDNTRCLHGRRAFPGGTREILTRMGDARL